MRAFLVALSLVAACSGAPPVREEAPRPEPARTPDAGIVAVEIDAPPDAAPAADLPLVCEPYDPKNPACMNDPRSCLQPGVDCKCPSPPDVENPACWTTMPCPKVPDRRVRACRFTPPPCDPAHPDSDHPNCKPAVVIGRVIKTQVNGGDTILTIAVGTDHGITKHWRATLLRGDSDQALAGGSITIVRVDPRVSVGKLSTTDVTLANPRVRFTPR